MSPIDDDTLLRDVFHNDDYFQQFLVCSQRTVHHSLSVADQLNKLAEGIILVDKEIEKQVLENHEDLLLQATWIEKLEKVLEMMSNHVQTLLAGVERLRSSLSEPFKKIETQNLILGRIWETLDVLRHISRIQVVSRRLDAQIQSDANDLVKLSGNIRDLNELICEMDVTNIQVVKADIQKLKKARSDVGKRAKHMLLIGLQTHNRTQILQALQVVDNLQMLVIVVEEVTSSAKSSLQLSMKESLDPRTLVQAPNTSPFRPRFWSTLEKLLDAIYVQCIYVESLEVSLRDTCADVMGFNLPPLIDKFPPAERNVAATFWNGVTNFLAECLNKASAQSPFVKQALEGEYPKFLRLYIELCKRVEGSDKPDNFASPFTINKNVISQFEKSYLSKSVSMVLDPIHNMFSKDDVPEPDQVDLLIRTIRSELSVALFDPNLSCTIARNITKAVRQFCSNCENLIDRGPDATQVIGPRRTVQDKNVAIANLMEYLKSKLNSVMSNLSATTDATMIVSLSLVEADNLIANIISPVLKAVEKAIQDILFTMHNEDFSKESTKTKISTSLYMRELQEFIGRAHATYLLPFHSHDVVAKCASATGRRCVELFMRNVSVIRPLSAYGRAKLVADCNQVEVAVAPLLGDDPKTYRLLRSFRSLLSQTPQEILHNPAVGEIVPVSLVLFYLFSSAPEEIKSPHQSGVNWTVEELSSWLDGHESEKERLGLVSGSLGRYCNHVRQQQGKNFDAIYAIMAELIQRSGPQ